MPEKIIQVSKETLEKRIREGKITLPGDPTNPPPNENKPVEITASVNTPVNTLGGIPTKGIGRRRFLVGAGAALVLGGLATVYGIEYDFYYLDELAWRIKRSPFTDDELPSGWEQLGNYGPWLGTGDHWPYNGKASGINIFLSKKQDTLSRPGDLPEISFTTYVSSEAAQTDFKAYGKPPSLSALRAFDLQRYGIKQVTQPISGIGDMALLDLSSPKEGYCYAAVDRVTFEIKGGKGYGDEQTLLNLAKSSIKYLARIGVTPSIK